MEDTLSKFMSESAKRHEENSNLIKEIRASTDAAIRNQGASIKTLEIQIGQNSTPLYKARQTTVPFPSRLDNHYYEEEGNYGPKFTEACGASHINNAIPRKEKDLGSFTLHCFINDFCFDNALVDLGASVSVMPLSTYLNLGLGELAHTRRNQGDDIMPTIEEGEVIEEFRTRDDELDTEIDDYPRALMNVPIFVGTFFDVSDFAVLEDMDAYRDEGMDDVIFGEPFLREVGIKTNWFEGIITLYKSDDEVTYQMVRSHPRFKHHTNEQCNKIPPLLKVSEKDKKNGISHAYQKLKGFYKGVLNLGSDYIIMRRQKIGSHAGTSACMHWIKKEAEKKSNLKTSL
ncbi:homeodomain-like protein [Tanacetum coccineum]